MLIHVETTSQMMFKVIPARSPSEHLGVVGIKEIKEWDLANYQGKVLLNGLALVPVGIWEIESVDVSIESTHWG